MAFLRVSSPHAHSASTTSGVMQQVLLATIPGIVALSTYFGAGSVINILLAVVCAVGFEATVLTIRKKPIVFNLKDYSAVVTAVLLAVALPPYCPWWVVVTGIFFSIVVAKQLYGGLGYNPFNPAMVGYVVLLISFPLEMTQWAAPRGILSADQSLVGLSAFLYKFGLGANLDAISAATPLDIVKQNAGLTMQALSQNTPVFNTGKFAGNGWEVVNLAFLGGGLYLLAKKIFTWHAPVAMLATLTVCSALFYDSGSSNSGGSPTVHLLSGGTMLGAFFIITDPVSSAVSNKGRLIFGGLAGLLIYVIRVWGNYPDAVAFAVLLVNFAAPFIDYYTLPKTYGHNKPGRATAKK